MQGAKSARCIAWCPETRRAGTALKVAITLTPQLAPDMHGTNVSTGNVYNKSLALYMYRLLT